jgi:hypothetical protein
MNPEPDDIGIIIECHIIIIYPFNPETRNNSIIFNCIIGLPTTFSCSVVNVLAFGKIQRPYSRDKQQTKKRNRVQRYLVRRSEMIYMGTEYKTLPYRKPKKYLDSS